MPLAGAELSSFALDYLRFEYLAKCYWIKDIDKIREQKVRFYRLTSDAMPHRMIIKYFKEIKHVALNTTKLW